MLIEDFNSALVINKTNEPDDWILVSRYSELDGVVLCGRLRVFLMPLWPTRTDG